MNKFLSLFAFLLVSNATWAAESNPADTEDTRAQTRCEICLQGFCEGEDITFINCASQHNKFHTECIDEWFKEQKRCPFCGSTKPAIFMRLQENPELIIQAVQQNNLNEINLFIEAGVNLDYFNGYETALTQAIQQNKTHIAQLLINGGANVNIPDEFGRTPLILATRTHQLGIANALITSGADLNIQDSDGNTALIEAVRFSALEILQKLIQAKADLNIQNNFAFMRSTALITAVQEKNIPAVRLLLIAGADTNITNALNQTALAVAKRVGDKQIIDLLQKYGAQ